MSLHLWSDFYPLSCGVEGCPTWHRPATWTPPYKASWHWLVSFRRSTDRRGCGVQTRTLKFWGTAPDTLTQTLLLRPVMIQHEATWLKNNSLSSLFAFAASRGFVDVGACQFSNIKAVKKQVLKTFKRTISDSNSEFADNSQKVRTLFNYDTHSFLN